MIKELTKEKTSLPAGWVMKKLIELGEVQTGTTPSTSNKGFYGDFIPFVKPPHFNSDGTISFSSSGLSEIGLAKGRLIKENSILMVCIGASIGKTGITPIPISCNQQINAFSPNENCLPKFYYHLLSSDYFFKKVMKRSSQATLPMINKTKWQNIEIPLPPLTQQKQIVALLDKAFAAIDTAKANTTQNLQNAKELFESYLENVFENKGDDWEEKTLGEVCAFFNGFAFKSKDSIDNSNTQVIRMGNLYQNKLNLERKPAFYPDDFATEYSKYLLKENDLIISLTGTTGKEDYGYTVKIPKTEKNLLLNQRIAKFVIKNENVINRNFLFKFLLSRTFLDELYKTANGTRQANLSTETMKGLFISFPPIGEQKKIVQKLDSLSTETKKLEAIYTQKLADLEELKKSILQKAFSGQLTIKK